MEDDAPVIYGLEFQARALTPQVAEADVIRFLVGTQSLKNDNQVHLLEFDDESNILNKTVYRHRDGEIWQVGSSPADKSVLSTCYNTIADNKVATRGAVWRLPSDADPDEGEPEIQDDSSSFARPLENLCRLDTKDIGNLVSILWEPQGDGDRLLSVSETHLTQWDLQASSDSGAKVTSSVALESKGHPKFTAGRWNPHHNNAQAATANDNTIRGWDLRTMKQCYTIENAHSQMVRDLDFNPNKQYFLATCGDDCKVKFWDVRNPESAVLTLTDHSHWVWSVRYNQFHDQLVLSSSSDSRVVLTNAASISSEPFGHLDDEDDDSDRDEEAETKPKEPIVDGLIANYEEHEDSVYAAEWSTVDPWLFASLSYDGRLVINRVPKAEKYKILL